MTGMAGGDGGTGGAGGQAGSSTRQDASVPGNRDAGVPGSRDAAASDAAYSPISGFALCVVCHGPEGRGVPDKGPEIQHPVIDFSTWVVRNGRVHPGYKEPMMKYTVDQVSDAQLQGIFTFLASPPKPTTGKGLYDDYCGNCHGADGKGGVTMRDISSEPLNVFIADSRGGHHPGEFENRREYMLKWTPAELSDAELRLIFAYIDGL
jgi:mono/diheme cytochrome c family protein